MKKIIIYALTTIMAISSFAACSSGNDKTAAPTNKLEKIAAEGKLKVATSPDFAPYEFIDMTKTGQDSIVGADMDLAKYIAEQLGVELVIESMSFDAALAAVTEGKVDLTISGLAWKEDRAKVMELSDMYNLGGYQGIMVLKADLDNYKTAEDFAGKKIGAQNASLQYENVVTQLPDAKVEIVTSVSEGILMLQTGKIDALAMSGTSGDQYCLNYNDVAMSEFLFETDSTGNTIGITKGEVELLGKINEILKKVNDEDLYTVWKDNATELSATLGVNK